MNGSIEHDHPRRVAQPPHVPVVQERPPVIRAHRFVDALAVEEAVVEHRDDGIAIAADAAVDVDVADMEASRNIPLWSTSRNSNDPNDVNVLNDRTARTIRTSNDQLMRILNAAQMREADRYTIEEIGIPSLVLMENAGRQVVAAMEAAYETRLDGRVGGAVRPRQQRRRRLRRRAER